MHWNSNLLYYNESLHSCNIFHLNVFAIKCTNASNYAPNFKEFDGAYWFWVVHACVHPFVKNRACEGFEISYMDFSWKNT